MVAPVVVQAIVASKDLSNFFEAGVIVGVATDSSSPEAKVTSIALIRYCAVCVFVKVTDCVYFFASAVQVLDFAE